MVQNVYLNARVKRIPHDLKSFYQFDSGDEKLSNIELIQKYMKLGIKKKEEEKNREYLDLHIDEIRDVIDLFMLSQGAILRGIEDEKIDEDKWPKYQKIIRRAFENIYKRK